MAATANADLQSALRHAQALLARDPVSAQAQTEAILRAIPDQPNALMLRAMAAKAQGNFDNARTDLQRLTRTRPDWAAAWMELGHMLSSADDGLEAAEQAYHRALQAQENLPGAWEGLGNCRLLRGDAPGAQDAFQQQLRFALRDRELMNAADALARGDVPVAERLLKDYLYQHPSNPSAIRMLAEVAARLGRQEDALHLLERCLELAPDFHEARLHRVLMLNRANRAIDALQALRPLLAASPAHLPYRNLEAVLYGQIGEYERAIVLYRDLLDRHPTHPQIWLSYAHALKTAGRSADAISAYREAIRLQPDFGDAYWSLANLKTFRFDADDLQRMRAHLRRDDLKDEDRLHFDFALGKALEDAGDHETAFRHYVAGNALRRRQVPYSAEENRKRTDHAIETFTPEFFARRDGWGHASAEPIFVVGMPRAGSTLIEQILASHSHVEGTMELPEILGITRHLRLRGDGRLSTPYVDLLQDLDADTLRDLGERFLERTHVHRKAGKPFFIDKMPNNFAHIGLIHLILPNAKIIDARRHPMACCFSNFKQHFARGQHFSYDLVDMGRYYADYVRWMAHVDEILPGHVHRVHYETMVADTENEVRRMLAYCGLPFEDGCLRFFENERPVRTASSEQVRQPIYREGVDQWQHFAPWLDALREALGPIAETYPEVPSHNQREGVA